MFKNRFPKDGPTCRRPVVNPRHQTSQGQSVAKHETCSLIVEHQIPSIKVFFLNKCQKSQASWYQTIIIREQNTIGKPKKSELIEKSIYIYIYIDTELLTKVIRRKHIIQPTDFGACSSTCCQWDGEDVPAPWERSNSHPPVLVQKSCVNQFI